MTALTVPEISQLNRLTRRANPALVLVAPAFAVGQPVRILVGGYAGDSAQVRAVSERGTFQVLTHSGIILGYFQAGQLAAEGGAE